MNSRPKRDVEPTYATDEDVAEAKEAIRLLDKLALDVAAAVIEALISPEVNVLRARLAGILSANVTDRARRTSAFFDSALTHDERLLQQLTNNTRMHLVRAQDDAAAARSVLEIPHAEVIEFASWFAPHLLKEPA